MSSSWNVKRLIEGSVESEVQDKPCNRVGGEKQPRLWFGRSRRPAPVHEAHSERATAGVDCPPHEDIGGDELEWQRTVTSNYAEDDAWDSIRPGLQAAYLQQQPQQRQLDHALAQAAASIYTTTLESRYCSPGDGGSSSSSGGGVNSRDDSSSAANAGTGCRGCGSQQLRLLGHVPVLVIDISSQVRIQVPIMGCCTPGCSCRTAAQPLELSCWPSNPRAAQDLTTAPPSQEQTWFTLRLMAFADFMVMIARRVPMYRFCEVLLHYHVSMGFQLAPARLDKLLGPALLQYGYLQCWLGDLRHHGVELPSGPLADCAACCQQAQSARGVHSIFVDFCFKLPHLASATRNWEPREPPNAKYFLPSKQVRDWMQDKHNMAKPDSDKDCSDFKAAEDVARRCQQRDVTAVGAAVCRHGMPVLAMDIETGERYCYSTLFLMQLLVVYGILVCFLWYDVNCRYAAHFLMWAARQEGELKEKLDRALQKVRPRFPLPPFHQYAHSARCQREHGALRMEGAGRPPGEPVEPLWAALGEHGWATQYMHLHRRRGRLERALAWIAQGAAARLPTMLVDMYVRAAQQHGSAAAQIGAIMDCLTQSPQPGEAGADRQQVQMWLEGYRAAGSAATAAAVSNDAKTWDVDWVVLKLQLHYIQLDRASELPGIGVAFADKVFGNAAGKEDSLRKKLHALERKQGRSAAGLPEVDSPSFTPYLQKYITYEVGRLRSSLRLLSIDFLHLDQYMNKVAGRPQLLKVVRSNKERTEKAMRRDLETLQQLLAKGLDYLPAEVQEDVRAHPDWTVDLLKRGELFEVQAARGGAADAGRNLLLSRLDHHVNEYARAREEMKQVLSEMQDAQQYYSNRLLAISARLEALPQTQDAVGEPTASSSTAEQLLGPLQLQSTEQGMRWFLDQQRCHAKQVHAHACALFDPVLSKRATATATGSSSGAFSSISSGGGGVGRVQAHPTASDAASLAVEAQLEAVAAADAAEALNAVALDQPGHLLSFGLGSIEEVEASDGLE